MASIVTTVRAETMEELLTRMEDMLIGREHGPLAFRLVIQPMMAALLAFRAGMRDARSGRAAFSWALLTHSGDRLDRLRAVWKDLSRLFVFAVLIDIIYQMIVFRWIYPGQALIVAAAVAFPPYLLIRGVANRLTRPRLDARARSQRSVAVGLGESDNPNDQPI